MRGGSHTAGISQNLVVLWDEPGLRYSALYDTE